MYWWRTPPCSLSHTHTREPASVYLLLYTLIFNSSIGFKPFFLPIRTGYRLVNQLYRRLPGWYSNLKLFFFLHPYWSCHVKEIKKYISNVTLEMRNSTGSRRCLISWTCLSAYSTQSTDQISNLWITNVFKIFSGYNQDTRNMNWPAVKVDKDVKSLTECPPPKILVLHFCDVFPTEYTVLTLRWKNCHYMLCLSL